MSERNSIDNVSVSSSNEEGGAPQTYNGLADDTTSLNTLSRKTTLASIIRDSIGPNDDNENYDQFTEKEIYPDMKESQIKLQRTRSRAAIINTLEKRATLEQLRNTQTDEEIALSRTKSFYEGAVREEGLPTENDGLEFQKIDPELVT